MLEESSNDLVISWFEKRLDAFPKYLPDRVRAYMEYVKFKTSVAHSGGAAIGFPTELITALDKNRALYLMQDKDI